MPKGDSALNKWYGTTVTDDDTPWFYINEKERGVTHNGFLSIEPIHSDFEKNYELKDWGVKWIIVGAETGNRKGKVIPKKEWVMHLVESCAVSGVPIFMKESLREMMGEDFVQELPWEK